MGITLLFVTIATLAVILALIAIRVSTLSVRRLETIFATAAQKAYEARSPYDNSVDEAVTIASRRRDVAMTPESIRLIKALLTEAIVDPHPSWPRSSQARLLSSVRDPVSLAGMMVRAAEEEGSTDRGAPLSAFDIMHWVDRHAPELLGGPVEKGAVEERAVEERAVEEE